MARASRRLVLAAAAVMLLAALTAAASAVTNSVSVSPALAQVDPAGGVKVRLVAEPPSGTLAAWVVEVRFDPKVVTTDNYGCDTLDTPAGAAGAMGCEVTDANGDGLRDTVKVFGGIVYSGSGDGLRDTAVLAEIEFEAAGQPGQCTHLAVKVLEFRDSSGRATGPTVSDGRICISGAPPSSPAPLSGPTQGAGHPAATPSGDAGGSTDGGGVTGGAAAPAATPGNGGDSGRPDDSDVTLAGPEATADALRVDRPGGAEEGEATAGLESGEGEGGGGKMLLWVALAAGVVVAGACGALALRFYRRRA